MRVRQTFFEKVKKNISLETIRINKINLKIGINLKLNVRGYDKTDRLIQDQSGK